MIAFDSVFETKKQKEKLEYIQREIWGGFSMRPFTDKFDFVCNLFGRKRCSTCNGLGHVQGS